MLITTFNMLWQYGRRAFALRFTFLRTKRVRIHATNIKKSVYLTNSFCIFKYNILIDIFEIVHKIIAFFFYSP